MFCRCRSTSSGGSGGKGGGPAGSGWKRLNRPMLGFFFSSLGARRIMGDVALLSRERGMTFAL